MRNATPERRVSISIGMTDAPRWRVWSRATCRLTCLLVLGVQVCGSWLPASAALAATPLERLFFTPEERLSLEHLRRGEAGSTHEASQADNGSHTEEKPRTYTLDGVVSSKRKVQALWLNGIRYDRTELPPYVHPRPPYATGRISLRAPGTGTSYPLRTGQTVDVTSGRILDAYQRLPSVPTGTSAGTTTNPTPAPPTSGQTAPSAQPLQGPPPPTP